MPYCLHASPIHVGQPCSLSGQSREPCLPLPKMCACAYVFAWFTACRLTRSNALPRAFLGGPGRLLCILSFLIAFLSSSIKSIISTPAIPTNRSVRGPMHRALLHTICLLQWRANICGKTSALRHLHFSVEVLPSPRLRWSVLLYRRSCRDSTRIAMLPQSTLTVVMCA